MSSHSPSRKPTERGHVMGRGSSRSRSSVYRRSNKSGEFHSLKRRSRSPLNVSSGRFPPEKHKSPIKKSSERAESSSCGVNFHPGDKMPTSSKRSTLPLNERKGDNLKAPGRLGREKSIEGKADKPIFRGPEEGDVKLDIDELKRVTVTIVRSLPKKEKVVKPRTIINPETITPVRRPDEGSRPIFARPELMTVPKDDSEEHRRVGTRKSLENDLHLKRGHSESPHGSHQSDHKKRNPSSYDGKRRRSQSRIDKNHRRSRSYSRGRHGEKESKRYSKERERKKSETDKPHRVTPPSSNRRRRSRSSSWEKHRDNERERRRREERHHREGDERRSRRDLPLDEYRDHIEPNERYHAQERYDFPRPRGGIRGLRPFNPLRPIFLAPPMIGYRPPPPGHCYPPPWINPGFRPPRPPPYAQRFPHPYGPTN